jgi:Protein of unknown function (DUF3467)
MNKEAKSVTAAAPAAVQTPTASNGQPPARQASVVTSNLKSSYCNMCSANATREEIVLNFGLNQDWDRALPNPELTLEHRVILHPALAKRLAQLLNKVVADYETRHGVLG